MHKATALRKVQRNAHLQLIMQKHRGTACLSVIFNETSLKTITKSFIHNQQAKLWETFVNLTQEQAL
jgi:hypothetical protein